MQYLRFRVDQSTKEWRYKLFDHSYPIKPIWGVLLVIALGMAFFYIVWPGPVKTVLVAAFVLLFASLIKRLVRELQYKLRFVRESQKDEKKVVETSLSEPPLYSQTRD